MAVQPICAPHMGPAVENRRCCLSSSMAGVRFLLWRCEDIRREYRSQFITDSCGAPVAATGRAFDWSAWHFRCMHVVTVFSHVMNFYHLWKGGEKNQQAADRLHETFEGIGSRKCLNQLLIVFQAVLSTSINTSTLNLKKTYNEVWWM